MSDQPLTEKPPTRFQCRHLRAAGVRCGMAALRDQNFCFYHQASHRPVAKFRYPDAAKEPFTFPIVEDRASIQLAISQVLARIASNDLDSKRAGLLLYGLQIAAGALPPEPRSSVARDTVQQGRARIQAILADLRAGRRPRKYSATEEDEILDTLDDLDNLTLDPDLGPLAPQTRLPDPEDEPPTYAERVMAQFRKPPTPETAEPVPAPETAVNPAPEPAPTTLPKIQAAAETPETPTTTPDAPSLAPQPARSPKQHRQPGSVAGRSPRCRVACAFNAAKASPRASASRCVSRKLPLPLTARPTKGTIAKLPRNKISGPQQGARPWAIQSSRRESILSITSGPFSRASAPSSSWTGSWAPATMPLSARAT